MAETTGSPQQPSKPPPPSWGRSLAPIAIIAATSLTIVIGIMAVT